MSLEIVFLALWNVVVTTLLLWLIKKFFYLGTGVKEQNAVAILDREMLLREKMEKTLTTIKEEVGQLQQKSRKSLRRVGILRFNPYNDVGGDQSFAVALLDDGASGLVFSSLHGREGTRIYAKPVEKGEAKEYSLSEEEKEAIEVARK